ncbi:MAG: hypothetical protein ACYCXX_14705 [Acidiferrobacter thiooxydans]
MTVAALCHPFEEISPYAHVLLSWLVGAISEFVVDDTALGWPESLGYAVPHGPGIAAAEPADPYYHNVVLEGHRR